MKERERNININIDLEALYYCIILIKKEVCLILFLNILRF